MKESISYDPVVAFADDSEVAFFLEDAFKTEDAGRIAEAIGTVARIRGMAVLSGQTGLSREQLYRSFSKNGNPTLKTLMAIMKALDMAIYVRSKT